jgi:acetolactate synthase-1/2/3 large subunit
VNGAESLLATARDAGIEVCFANPGTTELQFVAAFDSVGGVRPVLGLFEGVCTGAADGYARMAGKPALTLLHLGPGFANGIANLHNARRAKSPIVNLVGDHATWHASADAPLTSDIEALAGAVGWVGRARSGDLLATDLLDALDAAAGPPGRPATLIIPQDLAWGSSGRPATNRQPLRAQNVGKWSIEIESAARALRQGSRSVLFLGGVALRHRGLSAAARVAAATGCRVMHETFVSRLERGTGIPAFPRLPYFPEQARAVLEGTTHLVLAGAPDPVAFFGYPNQPSRMAPEECERIVLASNGVEEALESLVDALDAPRTSTVNAERPNIPEGSLTPESLCAAVASLQPEGAIVVDEAATTGFAYYDMAKSSPPHSLLQLTGGAIGQGLPSAVGAAVACPDRKVIAFQADGSGMYTVQALWTMARESLNVVVVICNNRKYRILQAELARAGISEPGGSALGLTELAPPVIDWVQLGRGMGVQSVSVETADQAVGAIRRSLAESGPSLIEARL